jgi:hypothetical protein
MPHRANGADWHPGAGQEAAEIANLHDDKNKDAKERAFHHHGSEGSQKQRGNKPDQ